MNCRKMGICNDVDAEVYAVQPGLNKTERMIRMISLASSCESYYRVVTE